MRRGRYGNRVSFKVSMDLPECCSVEELRAFIEDAIVVHNNGFRFGIKNETVLVRWPADYHGRYTDEANKEAREAVDQQREPPRQGLGQAR